MLRTLSCDLSAEESVKKLCGQLLQSGTYQAWQLISERISRARKCIWLVRERDLAARILHRIVQWLHEARSMIMTRMLSITPSPSFPITTAKQAKMLLHSVIELPILVLCSKLYDKIVVVML